MREYIKGQERPLDSRMKTVYMINRTGHIIYMSTIMKTLPDISDGVALVAYFYENPIEGQYFICDETGDIKGVSLTFS